MATALDPLTELRNLIIFAHEVHASFIQVDIEGTATLQGNPSITKAIPLSEVVAELERALSSEQISELRRGDSQQLAGHIRLDRHSAIFYAISLETEDDGRSLAPGARQAIWLDIELDVLTPFDL